MEMAESQDAHQCLLVEHLSLKDETEQKEEEAEEIIWNGKKLLVFDLETTGLEKDCDIVQISAILGCRAFDQYILPSKKINPHASKVNGLAVNDGELHYKGHRVVSTDAKTAMESFVSFLKDAGDEVVLAAHNGHRFDVPHLLRIMESVGVQLPSNVEGFLDSLPLARMCYPGRKGFKLQDLVLDILGLTFEAHNAAADVKALQSLLGAMLRDMDGSKQDAWGKCFRPSRRAVEK